MTDLEVRDLIVWEDKFKKELGLVVQTTRSKFFVKWANGEKATHTVMYTHENFNQWDENYFIVKKRKKDITT